MMPCANFMSCCADLNLGFPYDSINCIGSCRLCIMDNRAHCPFSRLLRADMQFMYSVHSAYYPHVTITRALCYVDITLSAITQATKRLPAHYK
ncbi:uncharacterized protein [Miscanthus floridulus]